MSLTPAQLQHKREHKADLRRRKHALLAYLRRNEEAEAYYSAPADEITVSPAPPSVTQEKKAASFFGKVKAAASRLWNRKV